MDTERAASITVAFAQIRSTADYLLLIPTILYIELAKVTGY